MNRNKFLRSLGLAAGALALGPPCYPTALVPTESDKVLVTGPRLQKGDKVALISPGSGLRGQMASRCLQNIEALGLKAVWAPHAKGKHGFLSDTDEARSSDVMWAIQNPEIKGIVCARGGYGTMRILDRLDYKVIRKNPKRLIGFSDITALHCALHKYAGLKSYHGPVGEWRLNSFSRQYMRKALFTDAPYTLRPPGDQKVQTLQGGTARGVLVGGNLSLLTALVGTPYDLSFKNRIVLIEEIDEEPYRVDRTLVQLKQAKKFQGVRGIVLGAFKACYHKEGIPMTRDGVQGTFVFEKKEAHNDIMTVIENHFKDLGVPAVYNFPIGHTSNNATVPIGARVTLNAERKTLHIHA